MAMVTWTLITKFIGTQTHDDKKTIKTTKPK